MKSTTGKYQRYTYWTLFYYGSVETICSVHKSFDAARRAARKCEKLGGAKHRIVMVEELEGYKA